jgi:hypothetical protein
MEPVKVWGGTIIDSFFNHKTGVQFGERVRIKFLGKKPLMNQNGTQRINAETKEPMFFNDYAVQHTLGHRATSKLPAEQAKAQIEQDAKKFDEMTGNGEVDPKNIPW